MDTPMPTFSKVQLYLTKVILTTRIGTRLSMEVCSAVSGARLARLSADDVEGKSVKEVKRLLAAEIGIPRFRQRIFVEDTWCELAGDEIVASVPVEVHLVLLEFAQGTGAADPEMLAACQRNDTAALERLLQLPSHPNLTDQRGWAPLHHAARNGHVQPIQLLFEAGAQKDSRAEEGTTAMWFAAQHGHFEVVRLLKEAGADCNQGKTDNGTTPLYAAAARGHLEVVRFLVEAGADCNQVTTDIGIIGATPLLLAAENGHLEVVRLFIQAGVDYNQATRDDGATPMFVAAQEGHWPVVQLLAEAGADCAKARRVPGAEAWIRRGHFTHYRRLIGSFLPTWEVGIWGLIGLIFNIFIVLFTSWISNVIHSQ